MLSIHQRLVILLIFFFPQLSTSTSRLTLPFNNSIINATSPGFRLTLHRLDSEQNLTNFQKIKSWIIRDSHHQHQVLSPSSGENVQSKVNPGNGEFLMMISIGTPRKPFLAIMDTGSDLIWTQCKPCKSCYTQKIPIFDPQKSSSFARLPCSSKLCSALPSSSCNQDGCQYDYTYGDYSSTHGAMGTETFSFESGVSVNNVTFGCGDDNEGDGFEQGSGLVGLGHGALSLVSQLSEPKFSYCLTSINDEKSSSSLLMGSMADPKSRIPKSITMKLLTNPVQPSFYYLPMEGISVGSTRLAIDVSSFEIQKDGSGGFIIDSGTTITYLENKVYDLVRDAFVTHTNMSRVNLGYGQLDLCFKLPTGGSVGEEVEFPRLVFHFAGGTDLEFPTDNYIITDTDMGLACMAIGPSSGLSILGNIQQQNMLVLYDLQNEKLSFMPTKCNKI